MTVCKVALKNITIVIYLEKISRELITLINEITELIKTKLPEGSFEPYQLDELHATLLGMEVIKVGNDLLNANFLNNNGSCCSIQPLELLSFLNTVVSSRQPVFTIRFGGFSQSQCKCEGPALHEWKCATSDADFHSYNRSDYEGSFYAFSNGPVMTSGWQVKSKTESASFPRELFGLRRAAGEYGFLDKFHTTEKPYWKDDDFYIRLGTFGDISDAQLENVVREVREFLSKREPIFVDVTIDDIEFVYYENASPLIAIERLPLREALAEPQKLLALYNRWEKEFDNPPKYEKWKRKLLTLPSINHPKRIDQLLSGRSKYASSFPHRPLPFAGVSVIHNIDSHMSATLDLSQMIDGLKSKIIDSELKEKIAFVDTKSFHVTIFDLLNEPEHQNKLEANGHNYATVKQEVEEASIQFLSDLKLEMSAIVTITGIGMFSPEVIKLDLQFPDVVLKMLQTFRLELHKYLLEHVDGYSSVRNEEWNKRLSGHITFAYIVDSMTEQEIDVLMKVLEDSNKKFNPIEFECTQGEVTAFSDMNHYLPVL